ncbi:MAG TPA: hypothetical protein VGK61_05210 [Planctomycetota bacterium]|jgi:hypothetical protein
MKRSISCAAVLALACGSLAMGFGGPPWMKLDQAKAAASALAKPIVVYATVNYKAEGC